MTTLVRDTNSYKNYKNEYFQPKCNTWDRMPPNRGCGEENAVCWPSPSSLQLPDALTC